MAINYIILAHKNPRQLKRLIERLTSDDCYFYIHIDKDVDIEIFRKEIEETNNIFFVDHSKRTASFWGDVGVVVACLNILSMLLAENRTGYCVLLSGQDYPLKDNNFIKSFFAGNQGKEYLNNFPLPSDKWPTGGKDRMNFYKVNFSSLKGDFLLYPCIWYADFYTRDNFKKVIKLISHKGFVPLLKLIRPRRFPRYISAYGGSQWWAITIEAAEKIIEFHKNHPNYLEYHRDTLLPDEIFFNSIIMDIYKNTPERICETLTYVNWERPGVILPVTFAREDFRELEAISSRVLFARKFDIEFDEEILNMIDDQLLASGKRMTEQ